ncbi:MAG: DUF481 domain-containing protein [Gammaproteobacteria bacterium]|nr:DUF481 domain-containing protein [Gammaproteobacteria bacterium]
MKKTYSILTAALLVTGNAVAEEAPKSLWKASAELGFVMTSGNTETETLNAKANVSTDRTQWRHKAEITALKSSDDISTTAEKYTLMGKSDYKLEGKNFLFGVITYDDDKFSGYDYRATEAIGYGRRVIEETDMTLDLEVGPGARQSKLDSGETDSEGILRAAATFDWTISKTSKFSEALTVEAGEDVTVTKSVTSLASQIEGNLSMKITFTYKNTSEVPVGVEETDTETAITLVYNF